MGKKHSYWREKLLTAQQALLAIDADISASRGAVELDQSKVGRLSRMDALQAQAMSNAVSARRKSQMSRIEAALARLDDGEFGFCIKCGDSIAEIRLEIDAAIALCAPCTR